jgi:Protein of unknown function (DUF1579)
MATTTSNKKAAKPARKTTKKTAKKAGAKGAMSEAAMMAQWQSAMTPGAWHKRLDPLVGKFKAKTEFVMAPGVPPMVHEGTSDNRWVLGGRYLEQAYRGTAMGMPFEGIGYTGYDNPSKRYVGTWMDTFGTGVMSSAGVGRPTPSKMTFVAEAVEPSGKPIVFDAIITVKNPDQHSYEMWTKAPNGKRFRNMIVTYVRA